MLGGGKMKQLRGGAEHGPRGAGRHRQDWPLFQVEVPMDAWGVRAVSPGQQDVCPDTDCVNKGPFKNAHAPQAGIPSSPLS